MRNETYMGDDNSYNPIGLIIVFGILVLFALSIKLFK